MGVLFCRVCGTPILPSGCLCCGVKPYRHLAEYRKPLGPRPLSAAATLYLFGMGVGFVVGLLTRLIW